MSRIRDLALLSLTVAACDGWPTHAHLPSDGRDLVQAPDDPRALVDVTWEVVPSDDADTAAEATPRALTLGNGLVFEGTLEGAGWSDLAVADLLEDEACPGQTGRRVPSDVGDYLGDVDVVVTSTGTAAQLCAAVEMGPTAYGWDLLLAEIDPCGIPVRYVASGAEAIGYGLGGAAGEWGHVVEADVDYAVQLAAYFPNDLEASLGYRLALSLVHPDADGTVGLCPLFPAEASR